MALKDRQLALVAALYDGAEPKGLRSDRGLSVHHDNLAHGVATQVSEAFPFLSALLGPENTRWMALQAVRRRPLSHAAAVPLHAVIQAVRTLPELAETPLLEDVARLEVALYRARRADVVPGMPPAEVERALAEAAETARLQVCTSWAALVIRAGTLAAWSAHRRDGRLPDAPMGSQREGVVVYQRDGEARVREVPAAWVPTLRALADRALGEVVVDVGAEHLARGLRVLVEAEVVHAVGT